MVSFQCLTLESSLAVISSRTLCFNIRSATFMLTNLVPNPNSWIPVSSTGMTPSTTQITCKLQCSYTKRMNHGMTVRGGMTSGLHYKLIIISKYRANFFAPRRKFISPTALHFGYVFSGSFIAVFLDFLIYSLHHL